MRKIIEHMLHESLSTLGVAWGRSSYHRLGAGCEVPTMPFLCKQLGIAIKQLLFKARRERESSIITTTLTFAPNLPVKSLQSQLFFGSTWFGGHSEALQAYELFSQAESRERERGH